MDFGKMEAGYSRVGLERAEEIEGAGEISRLAQTILIAREGGRRSAVGC